VKAIRSALPTPSISPKGPQEDGVRKTLASLFLGVALLFPSASAFAESPRPVEPRWGIRPERSAPSLLDFARWLSDRVRSTIILDDPEPEPTPTPAPSTETTPDTDFVCPTREHCPIG
jgi:hypothetical protein